MAKKTNKTSHVLNLITNGEPDVAQEPAKPAAAPEEITDKKTGDAKVTVVNADKENSEVSEEIQRQLMNQLAEELAKAEEAGAAAGEAETAVEEAGEAESVVAAAADNTVASDTEAAVAEPVAADAGAAVQKAEAVTEKSETAAVAKATVEKEEAAGAPAQAAESSRDAVPKEPPAETVAEKAEVKKEEEQTAAEEEESYNMVNVMERILGRANVLKQMEEYEVCTCSRCHADVLALVLTRLPAKYVVVDRTATNPMISYYESKTRMRVLTEMIKACVVVRENPRH